MAKFYVEVELNWIDNAEEGVNIDEEIKYQVINEIKSNLLKKATEEVVKKFDGEIAEKIKDAGELIKSKVDIFVENICEEKISNMKIPYKKNSWGSEIEYKTMSEFVGDRYEEFLNKKVLDKNGNTPNYESDRNTSLNEYFVNKYLQKELLGKISEMIKRAKKESEEMVVKTIEENLKNQLATDTIQRLNIPMLLRNLQEETFESEKNKQ
jgi:hypothetical protein